MKLNQIIGYIKISYISNNYFCDTESIIVPRPVAIKGFLSPCKMKLRAFHFSFMYVAISFCGERRRPGNEAKEITYKIRSHKISL